MSKRVLVIAAHPDDEVLGCGGAIARHVAQGDVVHVVFMADGVLSREGAAENDLVRRAQCAEEAARILGIAKVHRLGLPDNRMDEVPLLDVVKLLEKIVVGYAPEVVYTHYHGDLNIDHRITYQAAITACRPLPGSTVREILAFEVMSSTEWAGTAHMTFRPTIFIDTSRYWETKQRALNAYATEMRESPHSRSFEHLDVLARHRGHSVGVSRAEAFELVRSLR